jgi:hypothetical protein
MVWKRFIQVRMRVVISDVDDHAVAMAITIAMTTQE